MTAALVFVPINNKTEIDNLFKRINEWVNLVFRASDFEAKIQSISQNSDGLFFLFPGITPAHTHGNFEFELDDNKYQMEGDLTPQNDGFIFRHQLIFREQKRKLTRMVVPEGYPAHFDIEKIGGEDFTAKAVLLDIHGDGFQMTGPITMPLKFGLRLEGVIKIKDFPDVRVGGLIRHCLKRDDNLYAGVEIHHLDFGSEDKLRELLLFFRHDVFYFIKNKAKP